MTSNSKPAIPTTTVTLLKDGLTHAGKACAKGEVIEVTAADAEFLARLDYIAGKATAPAASKDK